MGKKALLLRSVCALTVDDIALAARHWRDDGECRQLSPDTLAGRDIVLEKLVWWLRENGAETCGKAEIRSFLAYLSRPHPEGRWGNPRLTAPAGASTSATYFQRLSAFFNFVVEEETWGLEASPLESLKPPIYRAHQIQPFSALEVEALLRVSLLTQHPRRDELILLFLLDTGARVSELVGLDWGKIDLKSRKCRVLGKGNKERTLPFGARTGRALWAYQREREHDDLTPLLLSDGGHTAGERLTKSGVLQLFERLGERARVEQARCSPHTCRHTFSINFLRAGGSMYALMELLGHTSLAMVKRYVALAQADIEQQHRQFSPVDRMKKVSRSGTAN